jgi:hypothetical protein
LPRDDSGDDRLPFDIVTQDLHAPEKPVPVKTPNFLHPSHKLWKLLVSLPLLVDGGHRGGDSNLTDELLHFPVIEIRN